MKNVNELRVQLAEVFAQLKEGTLDVKQAEAMTNLAGKMINSSKMQIEYYALRKESPYIKFLHSADKESPYIKFLPSADKEGK